MVPPPSPRCARTGRAIVKVRKVREIQTKEGKSYLLVGEETLIPSSRSRRELSQRIAATGGND